MLNLFLKKANNNDNSELEFFNRTDISDIHNKNNIGETRHYPPASKEWFNSIYSYNKNMIKTLPIVDKIVNKLIKGYFNLNPLSNNKKSSRVQVRFKRLSLNRILVSKAEMKHTNNKVIITVYLYNKNKKFFLYKLKNLYKTFIFKIAEKSQNLSKSSFSGARAGVSGKGTKQNKSLPLAIGQENSQRAGSRSGFAYVFNGLAAKNHKGSGLRTGLVKGKSSTNLNKSTKINRANAKASGWNGFDAKNRLKLILLKPANNVKKKNSSLLNSKSFKNSSRNRLNQQNAKFIKTNYFLNFTKLSQRNLSKFLLALNIDKKNTGAKALINKYKLLIKKYYLLLSNKKLNTVSNNNYFLNYVNIAKTNSSLKNNIALLGNAREKSHLYSVEQGEEARNFSLYYLALASLKKLSFFSTRLASGIAPGQEEALSVKTRRNNNYYKLFDNVKNTFSFENIFNALALGKKNRQTLGLKRKSGARVKKNITLAGWALYKLRNLHKLFNISPNASEIINASQKNSAFAFDKGQWLTSDIALKKRNFLIRNLHNILKNKNSILQVKKKIISAKALISDKSLISAKASASSIINLPSLKLTLKKINSISLKGLRILKKARKNKNFILKTLKWDANAKNFRNYETKYYKNFINKSYKKELLYLYYVKMLSLNNNKFKNWFILGLKRIISKIYHKKVEFNLVNLKYLHLNSDIFSESIAIKLRNRENRLLRVLKKALKLVKLPSLSKLSFYGLPSERLHSNSGKIIEKFNGNDSLTLNLNSYLSMLKDKDVLHELLYKIFPRWALANTVNSSINGQAQSVKNNLQENILNSTKHKNIYGVRLEAAGRLSRRLTASRSVFKLKYKGSLKNINSSYKGLSTVMLRGNTRSNIQLTKVSSKTRNGAFGLKGWISSN